MNGITYTPTVHMEHITKQFGRLTANDCVSLTVQPGEVLALLGENGAGKSTLMNILSGMYKPTGGRILLDGTEVEFDSPRDALQHGIGMIYQHFKLAEHMTGLENIIEGNNSGFFLNRKKGRKKIEELCRRTGLPLKLDIPVCNMSISEKQTLEILKVLYCDARVLILDEPTAVLTPQETEKLFTVLEAMKKSGHSIIIITHKLNEVMAVSDRIAVLRDGKNAGTAVTAETTPDELVRMMVGKGRNIVHPLSASGTDKPAVEVKDVCSVNCDGVYQLRNVSFTIHEGELLGVAGVAGSGQKTLCEVLSGMTPVTKGTIRYKGMSVVSPRDSRVDTKQVSVGFVPENRLGTGLIGSMDMVDNILLRAQYDDNSHFLNRAKIRAECREAIRVFDIKTQGIEYPVKMMSGGNIQKVMLAREVRGKPQFFIAAYPVRGLDTASTDAVYTMMHELCTKGVPVLLVGEDLDQLMTQCDRIMVMCGGEVMGIVPAHGVTREEIGDLMSGNKNPERISKLCASL
jgi:general nucleoside transport system ATP-binding protein